MEIYLEYLLFENIIVNYVIVTQISIFTKTRINRKNKIVGILIMSLFTVISYMKITSFFSSIIVKILIVNIFIYILFIPKEMTKYIKQIIYYYVILFMYLGIIISISLIFNIHLYKTLNKIIIYLISAIISYVINVFMWKMWKSDIANNDLVYNLVINGKKVKAFVDTGNNVKDSINNLDVIFIEKELYEILKSDKNFGKKVLLDISTLASNKEVYGYIVNDVFIEKKREYYYFSKIIFVFVDKKFNSSLNYKALISYDTYLEKLKGVYL